MEWDDWSVTAFVSEESAPAVCPAGSVATGFECDDSYCDNIRLTCHTVLGATIGSAGPWGPWFSEEGAPSDDRYECPAGQGVRGLRCDGGFCDNISLQCSDVGSVSSSAWESYTVSEEQGAYSVPTDHYLCGLECDGSNCDNKRARYCAW